MVTEILQEVLVLKAVTQALPSILETGDKAITKNTRELWKGGLRKQCEDKLKTPPRYAIEPFLASREHPHKNVTLKPNTNEQNY